jgi:hypothetical protein
MANGKGEAGRVRGHMAPGKAPCKAKLGPIAGFSQACSFVSRPCRHLAATPAAPGAGIPANTGKSAGIRLPESSPLGTTKGAGAACGINFLLCMFNGFAFDRPLCRRIKVNLLWAGFRLV